MRNYVILIILFLVLDGSCVSNSSQPPKGSELVKLMGQINELLDKIDANQSGVTLGPSLGSSLIEDHKKDISENCRLLIENPDIALPSMFNRLDNKKVPIHGARMVYFIVFEKTKSAESIPYIADYFEFESEEVSPYQDNLLSGPGAAISAARYITSLKLIDKKRTFLDQRKEIADRLRQWYRDYKKAQDKK